MPSFNLLSKLQRARPEGNLPQAPETCSFCRRKLPGGYFTLAGGPACFACASRYRAVEAPTPPPAQLDAFTRSILFGMAAAIVGCIAYALFGILTGISIGWGALAVGYLIGWAMRNGSRGHGGRPYQVAAVLLTYAAITVAFVPIAIHNRMLGVVDLASLHSAIYGSGTTFADLLYATPTLLGIGFLSPVLHFSTSFFSGAVNLLILSIGLRGAWRQTSAARANARAD